MSADTDDLNDFEASIEIGGNVLEMIDRLEPIDRIRPGSRAAWVFFADGVNYSLTLSVHSRGEPHIEGGQ